MTMISHRGAAVLTAVLAAACGEQGSVAADPPSTASGGAATFCPSAAEVTQTVGFTVQVLTQGTRSYGSAEMCAYQATDSSGTFVSLSVQPADPSEDPIAEVRSAAKTFLGSQMEAERIDVGDGGYAYESASKSEAAARKGDRVFRADITSTGGGGGGTKGAAVALLQRVVR